MKELDELADVAERITTTEQHLAELGARRSALIRTVLAHEPKIPRAEIAERARITEARLYQIRDGKR